MSPRADYVCNSKKCRQEDGSQPTYELPVGATLCAICGSRRIIRLWNSPPHIARGVAKRADALLEPGYVQQQQSRDRAAFPRKFPTLAAEQQIAPAFGVSLKGGISGAIAEGMAKHGLGNIPVPGIASVQGTAHPSPTHDPQLGGLKGQGMVKIDPRTVYMAPKGDRQGMSDKGARSTSS